MNMIIQIVTAIALTLSIILLAAFSSEKKTKNATKNL